MGFARLMGIVPLGIGLTLLTFLWGSSFGPFGGPPVIFRVMGSFVALMFILQGAALISGALGGPGSMKNMVRRLRALQQELQAELGEGPSDSERSAVGYHCTSCGAPLADNADVSPHGDVKCVHCGKWFNIHRTVG